MAAFARNNDDILGQASEQTVRLSSIAICCFHVRLPRLASNCASLAWLPIGGKLIFFIGHPDEMQTLERFQFRCARAIGFPGERVSRNYVMEFRASAIESSD